MYNRALVSHNKTVHNIYTTAVSHTETNDRQYQNGEQSESRHAPVYSDSKYRYNSSSGYKTSERLR